MKSFKSLVLIASLAAAGAAFADSSVVNLNTARQTQNGSGDRNVQSMELGTVDGGAFSGGRANVTATNLRQSQSGSGSRNVQSMILGKIDKDEGSHRTTVVAENVTQTQSGGGDRNRQTIKVGVIE